MFQQKDYYVNISHVCTFWTKDRICHATYVATMFNGTRTRKCLLDTVFKITEINRYGDNCIDGEIFLLC